MESKNKKQGLAFLAALVTALVVFLLVGGIYFFNFLRERIFEERTAQLVEITSQVRVNLNSALDAHWNYLTTAVNLMTDQEMEKAEDAAGAIGELEQILETDQYHSMLMLLDSEGNYYDVNGKHGVWSETDLISTGEYQYTFITDSQLYQGGYWAFVRKLDVPLETGDGAVVFTHAVLLKSVDSLSEYYDSVAYSGQNETYILKGNGTRMHDDTVRGNTIQAYNVIKALEEMERQPVSDIRAALQADDTISSNFRYNGMEYYYCLTSVEKYDTLLLFLIPAEFVAPGTVGMMEATVGTLLLLVVALFILLALAATAFVRQQNGVRLVRLERENLRRQEELNQQLEESNAMLSQAKETAEQAFRIAEDANRAKSLFLSNMSHDIRTPMNAVVGFAALLSRDAENPEKVREYTRKITSSSQHLLGLINDILDISKIEAGKTVLNLSEGSIVELVENIDSIIRPQAKAKGHTFEVYNENVKNERVIMDTLRMNQILLNLLSNAVKYTPDGGQIVLTIRELPQHTQQLAMYRFTVADNGYGMSEEYQKKLFDAFTREEDSITNKIQGTGLGMAITKNLIDLMGGTIAVDSKQGRGTTFTVDLILPVSASSADQDFWREHSITRLLAVDDEEVIVQNIQMTMEDTGVLVDYTFDGESAVKMVEQSNHDSQPYDIVLLDWKMPGMDGLEAARQIRQKIHKDVPILILTSYDWEEAEDKFHDAGVDAILPKPFFLTNFRKAVDSILNRNIGTQPKDILTDDVQSILHGMHILVAEDNEINAEILSELLDIEGATCEICENGERIAEAFENSVPGQYQLILMDVQMPVMNGYEATRAIRGCAHPLAKEIPIVAMTANAFAEDIRDALDAGMDAHVAKPVDMAILSQTVREVLGNKQTVTEK